MNILNFREAQSQFHKKLKTEKEQPNLSKGKNILEKPKVTPKQIKMITSQIKLRGERYGMKDWAAILGEGCH